MLLSTGSSFQVQLCLEPGRTPDQGPRSGWDGSRHSYPRSSHGPSGPLLLLTNLVLEALPAG